MGGSSVKRVLCLLFILVAVYATGAEFKEVVHKSEVLQTEKSFLIHVPEGAGPENRLPVLYILHGAYSNPKDWVTSTTVTSLVENYRMIVVLPDGSELGWYVDSPIVKNSRYETYVSKDLVDYVDAHYPTVKDRTGRGIMGLSMGGHGALLLTAKHPDVFGSASSMSGILKISNHPGKWTIAEKLGPLDQNRQLWEANSVWDQAERFKDANVRILFDCGVEDTKTGAIGDNRELHEKLTALKIPHIWREMPGTHSWKYWRRHLESHMNFHQAAMLEASPSGDRWFQLYYKRIREFLDENARLTIEPATGTTVCILGSSSMHGFPSNLLPGVRVFNRGISSDQLGVGRRGVSRRLECSALDMKPDFIFIKNGRNNMQAAKDQGKPYMDNLIREYEKIVTTIQERLPATHIYIVTCAPTRDKYERIAAPTAEYNRHLRKLAARLGVGLVDLHKELVGENNLLKQEFSRDGLHLSPAGNEIFGRMMMQEIEKHKQKP